MMYATNRKLGTLFNLCLKRQVHRNAELVDNCKEVINRNPRNLERLRIARKPSGYHLEKPGIACWHKLVVTQNRRHVTAELQHFENGTVISACTGEWGIKKQLYSTTDTAAYINLARVFAQRCLKSGICEMRSDFKSSSIKYKLFQKTLQDNGVHLSEPKRYIHPMPWELHRLEKPWEVFD